MKNTFLFISLVLFSTFGFAQDTLQTPLEFVQEMPTYLGGENEMYKVIFNNLQYPVFEKSLKVEGTVFVNFVVEKDGTPTHFNVTLGVQNGPGLNAEALKVCQKLGKFNPGKLNGVPQRVYLTLPIKFALDDERDLDEVLSNSELKQIQKDAKLFCELVLKMEAAEKAHDQENMKKIAEETDHLIAILSADYPKGSTKAKELKKLIDPCIEDAMKGAMEK
jgi:TonB family protein